MGEQFVLQGELKATQRNTELKEMKKALLTAIIISALVEAEGEL